MLTKAVSSKEVYNSLNKLHVKNLYASTWRGSASVSCRNQLRKDIAEGVNIESSQYGKIFAEISV